ncbi:MAG: NAD(P)-binding domain-containing protein [Firmicutes bacterium]|nr:NAD(P)-binding domain-containing protein [Bacillota bacterium]
MYNIVFCGGDRRELIVMEALSAAGYRIKAYGWPAEILPEKAEVVTDIAAALREADACILPQPPLGREGQLISMTGGPPILRQEDISLLRPGTPVFCGVAPPYLTCAAGHCHIFAMADDDELAAALAPASAEGAIAEALKLSDGLLAGKKALLLGFGRIGRELAWRLQGMGAALMILNRGQERADAAVAAGYEVADRSQLTSAALNADYIFNTVPAPVLDAHLIKRMPGNTCIIDVAAAPGGTDFNAAKRRGIKAVLAGGLPGRYAPRYAGEKMAACYLRLLSELLKEAHGDDA